MTEQQARYDPAKDPEVATVYTVDTFPHVINSANLQKWVCNELRN